MGIFIKFKQFIITCLAMIILASTTTNTYSKEKTPAYAFTDDHVIIDYVPYEINNNSINYKGMTFEIVNY